MRKKIVFISLIIISVALLGSDNTENPFITNQESVNFIADNTVNPFVAGKTNEEEKNKSENKKNINTSIVIEKFKKATEVQNQKEKIEGNRVIKSGKTIKDIEREEEIERIKKDKERKEKEKKELEMYLVNKKKEEEIKKPKYAIIPSESDLKRLSNFKILRTINGNFILEENLITTDPYINLYGLDGQRYISKKPLYKKPESMDLCIIEKKGKTTYIKSVTTQKKIKYNNGFEIDFKNKEKQYDIY